MARGVNIAIIVGTLGNDPELKQLPSGDSVANISVATNESWKDKNTGERIEKTEWHRIVVFGKLAEICGQYLKKGSQVYFEGKVQTRKWQDQNGQDRYSTEILASEMQMLGSRDQTGGDMTDRMSPQQNPGSSRQSDTPQDDDYLDDIPF